AALADCVQHAIADAESEQRVLQRTGDRAVESSQQLRGQMASRVQIDDRRAERPRLIEVVIPIRPSIRQFLERSAVGLLQLRAGRESVSNCGVQLRRT